MWVYTINVKQKSREVMKLKKRVLRSIRRMPQNLLRDKQIAEDIWDEMATKWAAKAERLQNQAFPVERVSKLSR
jgi:hypothetical protein